MLAPNVIAAAAHELRRQRWRLEMRKQDRIAAEQNRSPQHSETKEQPHPTEREQMKGSASQNPPRPQREKGKLPLPD